MCFRSCFALTLSLVVPLGCTDDAQLDLGAQCELNSECEAPLVCRLERCRNECTVSRDCPLGARCVVNNDGLGSCTLEEEESCTGAGDCPDILHCVVGSCRNVCEDDDDCAADATCEPVEDRRACFGAEGVPDGGRPRRDGATTDAARDAGPADGGGADAGTIPGVTPCTTDAGLPPCDGCTVTEVSAGGQHTCALRSDGRVLCWGRGSDGQLGVDVESSDVPLVVPDITNAIDVSAGSAHTCAALDDGTVRCWGSDAAGRLGDGSGDSSGPTPVTVAGLVGAPRNVSAGSQHTCVALGADGARCWGNDVSLALGNGTRGSSEEADAVEGLSGDVLEVSASNNHTCARTTTGVYCWGANFAGQVGNGTEGGGEDSARAVDTLTGADEIGTGASSPLYGHSCARVDGELLCWGSDQFGQLGTEADADANSPMAVPGLPADVVDLGVGPDHTCVVRASGEIWCWGTSVNQVTSGADTVERLGTVSDATRVSGGGTGTANRHACAVVAGGVACWGSNGWGQLGAGPEAPGEATEPYSVCGLD